MVYTLQVLTERASNERPARRSILVNEPVQVKERETIHYRDVTHFEKKMRYQYRAEGWREPAAASSLACRAVTAVALE